MNKYIRYTHKNKRDLSHSTPSCPLFWIKVVGNRVCFKKKLIFFLHVETCRKVWWSCIMKFNFTMCGAIIWQWLLMGQASFNTARFIYYNIIVYASFLLLFSVTEFKKGSPELTRWFVLMQQNFYLFFFNKQVLLKLYSFNVIIWLT